MTNRFKENRGGRGFGVLDKTDREFLTPDFDSKTQVGEKAVGMFATADKPGVVRNSNNAQLEGDDIDDGDFGVDGNQTADFRRTSRNDGERG